MNKKTKVIFICTHNSCRSQMAEALLKNMAGDCFEVFSAGTKKTCVQPLSIKVIEELGIKMDNHYSKTLSEVDMSSMNIAVTVCDNAKESCPYISADVVIHKSFYDPSNFKGSENEKLQKFRETRDEIKTWLESEFKELCKKNRNKINHNN